MARTPSAVVLSERTARASSCSVIALLARVGP